MRVLIGKGRWEVAIQSPTYIVECHIHSLSLQYDALEAVYRAAPTTQQQAGCE